MESDPIAARALQHVVSGLGYDVETAGDGTEATVAVRDATLDLMVVGGANSLTVLAMADALRRTSSLPLLLVVEQVDPALVERFKALTPEGFFSRTDDDQCLRLAIELALQRSRSDRLNESATLISTEREMQFRGIFASAADGVIVSDEVGIILMANPRAEALFGYGNGELCGQSIEVMVPERLREKHRRVRDRYVPSSQARPMGKGLSIVARRKDGSEFPADISLSISKTTRGPIVTSMIQDISAKVKAELELKRLNRMLRVLSSCNEALIRAKSEAELLAAVGQAIVDVGNYPLVWVGYGSLEGSEPFRVAARIGEAGEPEYCWNAAGRGCGRFVQVLSTGRPVILHAADILDNQCEVAGQWNFAAAIGLPLRLDEAVIGVLGIFSQQEDAFNEDEIRLLEELASDLSFGIGFQRGELARQLTQSRLRLFEQAIESSGNGIMISDMSLPDKPIIHVNPAFERITGYPPSSVLGRNARFLLGGDVDQMALEELRSALRQGREARVVLRNYRCDGSLFWNELSVAPVHENDGQPTHFVGVINDITESKRYEEQLERQATHDALTGLANRALLFDRLTHAMLRAARGGERVAVMLMDLDRFKDINDTFGHQVGDEVLLDVASRIQSCVRSSDTVARLGGDEFVVLLADPPPQEDGIEKLARGILSKLAQSLVTPAGIEFFLDASIGISLSPNDGSTPEILLKNADAAMYRAKEQGGGTVCFFASEMEVRAHHRLTLEARLRRALERNEFVLHFQPQVNLASGRISGAEALLRWQSEDEGMVLPGEFIPIAEKSGLIMPIGQWVIAAAAQQQKQWINRGLAVVPVAINLSARQFREANRVDNIVAILADVELDHRWLELEITESLMLDNVDRVLDMLKSLRDLGLNVALDDFGTGYSSLSYLKRLAINVIKIDRAFVQDVTTNPEDAAIVQAIIGMAHSLGLSVVAEGVETEAQLNYLRAHQCDGMQGYFFSRPLDAEAFASLLRENRALPHSENVSGNRTLLLVDDEPNMLAALRRSLRREGYRVLTAGSGDEALQMLAQHAVQVIVSDQRMPRMSGLELLGRVQLGYPETVRIILSGQSDPDSILQALNAGTIFHFLTKPWEDEKLRATIREGFLCYDARRNLSWR